MKISGIYKIQSIINPERCYIGSAINITQRWCVHLGSLKNKKHHSKKLQRHYDKYGKNDLIFSILIGCDKLDLITTEQFFIDSYNPYFNNCKTAGSMLGFKFSEETKLKQSISKKGISKTMEHNQKNSEAHKGKIPWNKGLHGIYSEESLKSMGISKKGKPRSEEVKQKLRDANTGKIRSSETKLKMKLSHKGLVGHKHSEETKRKLSLARIGKIPWNKGKRYKRSA